LKYYFAESQLVSQYKDTRNQLIGTDYSSKLSPWLALGCISPRFIHQELLKYEENFGANDSTYWLRYELLWRDFFRFMFKKHGNRYFSVFGISSQNNPPKSFDAKLFEAWKQGTTGDDFIDANMRELLVTGYMSNRGRQNVASYFCHRLQLDWRLGAAWFEEQLIDYDVSSNWGNWAYVAGVGNDARNREFNSVKQAALYDTDGKYRKLWLS
jgi:deoxyribodipyrimidine photo-lyase